MGCSLGRMGVSPGRGGYDLPVEADALVSKIRRRPANFFGSDDSDRVVYLSQ